MSRFDEIKARDKKYFMNTYAPLDICFESGDGCYLKDTEGKVYLDFLAGIAVNCLGYSHPVFTNALIEQGKKVSIISNYFYNENRGLMAEQLVKGTHLSKVFFGNSGAEANECAIKLARKYYKVKGENRYKIISTLQSFHGRTLATVTATGQEKYNKPFSPLPAGIGEYIPYNDEDALRNALEDNEVAALLLEPIQGEGGIIPATESYLKLARELTAEKGVLLIFDEVQTGAARTGKFWAFENYGVEPDILTCAKGIGGGVPISACLATDEVANAFVPGDHGTTFGAQPLVTGVGYAVCKKLREDGFMDEVAAKGNYLMSELKKIGDDRIKDVRGIGLIIGMEMESAELAKEIYARMLEKGYILNVCGGKVMRFVPPLIITIEQISEMITALKETIAEIK
ncbi:MAG: aspartate aminotransferase family protein [Clostridia bacterium]|nr:aspartate aminotransferase family protein [Clostridia bacterium]